MASTLTEAEKLTICTILGVDYIVLDYQINYYATRFTAASDAAIRAEIARWGESGAEFVRIEPKESNYGAKIDPSGAKADIKAHLRTLLYFSGLVGSTDRIQRS